METNSDLSSETLADETHVDSADGGETVENADTLSLTELNKVFGTDFKDKSSALKAIQETKAFVGKRKEDIAAELAKAQQANSSSDDTSLKSEVQSLKDELFYTQNPQFKDYRDVISRMGSNPAEVVGSDTFKKLFEKVLVADDVAQKKSVVSSSSRLSQSKSVIDEAVKVANSRASGIDLAELLARGIRGED